MAQARYKKPKNSSYIKSKAKNIPLHNEKLQKRLQEGVLIFSVALVCFVMLALISYHSTDPSWSCTGNEGNVKNLAGYIGSWIADILLCAFGYISYLIPLLLLISIWRSWQETKCCDTKVAAGERKAQSDKKNDSSDTHKQLFLWRFCGFLMFLCSGTALSDMYSRGKILPFGSGGVLGNILHTSIVKYLNVTGTAVILSAIFLIGITIFTGLSWLRIIVICGKFGEFLIVSLGFGFLALGKFLSFFCIFIWQKLRGYHLSQQDRPYFNENISDTKSTQVIFNKIKNAKKLLIVPKNAVLNEAKSKILTLSNLNKKDKSQPTEQVSVKIKPETNLEKQITLLNEYDNDLGDLPSLNLLDDYKHQQIVGYSAAQLQTMSNEVELRLKDFGIDAKVVEVCPGPVVTRFELELSAGTKVSRITTLAKDLARSLSVISVRVVEVIPGKSVIGLELPNEKREIVRLREVLASEQYEKTKASLALALGKDIAGVPIVADLGRMPHLLVAGTTGSGKSVCLNALLLSLLYKYTPQELRLILIDPKMLELSIYDGIPHLLVPVVTDMKEASNALRWSVSEMERRYKLMMSLGVRNIAGFNHKIKEARAKGKPILDPLWTPNYSPFVDGTNEEMPEHPELQELPYLVIFADEYADMIMVVGKKVEELIARIAQKARAAGIHLILATQRPSVDVITGLIKANIPSRIAFQVSSKIDSRTILDQSGADQLLGHGDMLYLPPGTAIPVRVHGAFVADEEVHRVVHDWQQRGTPEYIDSILDGNDCGTDASNGFDNNGELIDSDNEKDTFYDQAVEFVIDTGKVSISSIQRRFKIGYNRAARIVEAMENAGLVSAMETNGSRVVLISKANR